MRVASDGDSVVTVRATLARTGRTDRPRIRLPEDADPERFPPEEPVRVVADGRTYHAVIDYDLEDRLVIAGLYDNAARAREGDGENHLDAWADAADIEFGGSVLLDVVTAGFQFGLRAPGTDAVYTVLDEPDSSLADIARQVEDG